MDSKTKNDFTALGLLFTILVFLVVLILYNELYVDRTIQPGTNNGTSLNNCSSTEGIQCSTSETRSFTNRSGRQKRETVRDKALYFFFSNRDNLKKKYDKLFRDLHDKLLINSCPHMVKLTDSERMGECFMENIQDEIYDLYEREKKKLEDEMVLDNMPSFLRKRNYTSGIARGDVPLFHKLLKYHYFKSFDKFHLEFFHYLPLVIKDEIRHYFMFKFKGGFDVLTHERILYLEEKVDEWILKCANHTRMGSLGQDAFYEYEFLHEISPEVGEPHMMYEVTEQDFNAHYEEPVNFTMFMET
uniref:Uncharacterized protein n=2 Tax=Cacopsylla melanoneura TaxID=428564 RepID=A0A8D8VQW3_9HEMI